MDPKWAQIGPGPWAHGWAEPWAFIFQKIANQHFLKKIVSYGADFQTTSRNQNLYGFSNCHGFTKKCQFYIVLLSLFHFSFKNFFFILGHLESVLKDDENMPRHDTETHDPGQAPPPGDEIPREDLPSL